MELALITPIAHLSYTKLMPCDFVLANVAASNSAYCDFYAEQREKTNRLCIMDNGVFETDPIAEDRYREIIQTIKPHVVIAPDVISSDAEKNLQNAIDFCADTQQLLNFKVEFMHVVQCERRLGADYAFWQTLDNLLDSPIEWIGICRDAVYNAFGHVTHTKDQEINRLYFAQTLQRFWPTEKILRKKWHFLGMGKNVWALQYYWFVDTMDTASLFYQGVIGNTLSRGIQEETLKRPRDYFTRDFPDEILWRTRVVGNCHNAQMFADKATNLRLELVGERI